MEEGSSAKNAKQDRGNRLQPTTNNSLSSDHGIADGSNGDCRRFRRRVPTSEHGISGGSEEGSEDGMRLGFERVRKERKKDRVLGAQTINNDGETKQSKQSTIRREKQQPT